MQRPRLQALWQNWGRWFKDLKGKILSFDIKPAVPIVHELKTKVDAALTAQDYPQAIEYLQQILKINRTNYYALLWLSECYTKCACFNAAHVILNIMLKHYPNDVEANKMLGYVASLLGKNKQSIAAYKAALEAQPDLISTKHLLNAVEGINPSIAPREYVVMVFDEYADVFENHLLTKLAYCGHTELANFIASDANLPQELSAVLDLGCGTGLLGQELSKIFNIETLDGIDLATKMLLECEKKQLYTNLHHSDLLEYLDSSTNIYDLIVASDVFVYIGDLAPLFAQVHRCLKPGGYFAFSVESSKKDAFKLQPSGRYQHSLSYLTLLSANANYKKISSKAVDLRKEYVNMIAGYLVLLQK